MDPRKVNISDLPTTDLSYSGAAKNMTGEEVNYLYNLTDDEDFTPQAYARAKDMAVDVLMTNFAQVYTYSDLVLAADAVALVRPVRSRIGSYKKIGNNILDVSVSDTGSQDGGTNEIMQKVAEGTYATEIRKLKIFVSDDEISERGVLDMFQEGTTVLRYGIDIRQEIRIRNLAEATSNGVTIGTDWNTSAAINTEIATGKNTFLLANGQPATHIQFNYDVGNEMLANASAVAGMFGSIPSPLNAGTPLSEQDAMKFFKNNKPWGLTPIVTNAMYSTAVGPATTVVPAYVWPDAAFLFRVDKATRSTTWAIQPELMPKIIVRWRDEDRGGWYLKIAQKRDEIEATSTAIYEMGDVT